MSSITVGSLCTGIAGLDHALALAGLDTTPAFVSEIDPHASRWLADNVDAPNLGDFTQLDALPDCDILTAGFPCQGQSQAGKRKGIDDDRWLWPDIERVVGGMGTRPVLFLENVPGLLSANGGHAMADVVHGLARLGYQFAYGVLSAADVGAPHLRKRWWCVARHAESERGEPVETSSRTRRTQRATREPNRTAPTNSDGWERDRRQRTTRGQTQPRATPSWGSEAVVTNSSSVRLQQPGQQTPLNASRQTDPRSRSNADRFAGYGPAFARWETILGRPAPDPTTDGRLSAEFVEWMMGYPQGWVTGGDMSRRQALKALGNAVVPQCAAHAFTQLAQRLENK